jgi:hypothetical protein
MQEIITNAATGEVTIRDYTAAEIAARTPDPAAVLAQARAAAVDEMVAEGERKRLKVLRDALEVEFAGAKSAQAVADKMALLKAAR